MSDLPTITHPPSAPSSQRRAPRFVAGTMLAGRYRIVALLGSGGMGEVYRADDLKLEQSVALKFLPESLSLDPSALVRFHGEARLARQVSHQNVCRVFDIGEVEGLHYLSMEFVDGEDLGSLLRRVGRLPLDKAAEVARQLCAAVAAVHAMKILHRDLKPANVMIDREGHPKITDFGIAAVDVPAEPAGEVVGTLGYMAPEVLNGEPHSVRSDIFALGLVIYEMVTGTRPIPVDSGREAEAFDHKGPHIRRPSSVVPELDAATDETILRCLHPDPSRRPASASSVAMGLPGGDPLGQVVAAGETPSPEMVAASTSGAALSRRVAGVMAGTALIGFLLTAAIRPAVDAFAIDSPVMPPATLAARGRALLGDFGFPATEVVDSASGFDYSLSSFRFAAGLPGSAGRELLSSSRLVPVVFWYRESPSPMILESLGPAGAPARIGPITPLAPTLEPGMTILRLDRLGRLIYLRARPPADSTNGGAPFDFDKVLAAVGADQSSFSPVKPSWAPAEPFDASVAWEGRFPEHPDVPARLEAAASGSRLVGFRIRSPWEDPGFDAPGPASSGSRGEVLLASILIGLSLAAIYVAARNLSGGRGDRRGAAFTFFLVFGARVIDWLLTTAHVTGSGELLLFRLGVSGAAFDALTGYLLYLALEPYVRKRWPRVLIGWSRAVSGRLADPLVGREILAGLHLGAMCLVVDSVLRWIADALLLPVPSMSTSLRLVAGLVANAVANGVVLSIAFAFFMLAVRVLCRSKWAASILAAAASALVLVGGEPLPTTVDYVSMALFGAALVVGLLRFGLLSVGAQIFTLLLFSIPLTLDFTTWYSGASLFALAVGAGAVLWSWRMANAPGDDGARSTLQSPNA